MPAIFTDPRMEEMYGGTTGGSYQSYTIQPGDTLSQIAARFGTTVDQLAQLNYISDPNMIQSGRTLQIPYTGMDTGTQQYAAPTSTGSYQLPSSSAYTPYTPTTGGTTGGTGTYQTANGPKTLAQMAQELQNAGWSGGEDVLAAYQRTTGGGGGGGAGEPYFSTADEWAITWQIAQLEDLKAKARLAFDQERFKEYDMALLEIQQQEQELNRILSTAGMTGYLDGKPTMARQEMEGGLAYQQQALEQQASQFGQTFGLEEQRYQEAIRQVDRDYTENVRRYGMEFAEEQRQFDMQAALSTRQTDISQAGLTGWLGGQPTIEMAQLMGDPRNLAQTLTLLGFTPEETAQFLQGTPTVQNLMGTPGVSFQGGATPEGRNPLFPYISGRQLPVRQTLSDIQSGSQRIPLIEGMASLSGQTSGGFWGDFQSALPQGTKSPLTKFF